MCWFLFLIKIKTIHLSCHSNEKNWTGSSYTINDNFFRHSYLMIIDLRGKFILKQMNRWDALRPFFRTILCFYCLHYLNIGNGYSFIIHWHVIVNLTPNNNYPMSICFVFWNVLFLILLHTEIVYEEDRVQPERYLKNPEPKWMVPTNFYHVRIFCFCWHRYVSKQKGNNESI